MPFSRARRGHIVFCHCLISPHSLILFYSGTVAGRSVFHLYDQMGVPHVDASLESAQYYVSCVR